MSLRLPPAIEQAHSAIQSFPAVLKLRRVLGQGGLADSERVPTREDSRDAVGPPSIGPVFRRVHGIFLEVLPGDALWPAAPGSGAADGLNARILMESMGVMIMDSEQSCANVTVLFSPELAPLIHPHP